VMRGRLHDAAVAVAHAVSYVGAGTVEFLLAPSGDFYFLEMNTRLQVEHAITESVIHMLDLVRLQIIVAEGNPLPFTDTPLIRGHAIEARLYAEDPALAWLPSTGTLHRFHIPEVAAEFRSPTAPGLRLDSGVVDGSVIGVHYDPMLAKLIAWAPTRAEAARLLSSTLSRAHIHGVVTNRDLLVRVLRHPSFRSGTTDTSFLDRHPEVFAPLVSSMDTAKLSCLAAALASAAARRGPDDAVPSSLPIGWRNVGGVPQIVAYDGPAGTVEVTYRFDRTGRLETWSVRGVEREEAGIPGIHDIFDPDAHPPVSLVSARHDLVSLDVAGVRLEFLVHRVGDVSYVDSTEGSVTLVELPRFPMPENLDYTEGSLVAPLPGAIGRILIVPGQRVAAGDLLLTLEAMKMEHAVHAPSSGTVTAVPVSSGVQVDTGTILAVINPD